MIIDTVSSGVMSDTEDYASDVTDNGVEEDSGPISVEYKKTKLFQNVGNNTEAPAQKQNTPGKLKSWQPSSRYVTFQSMLICVVIAFLALSLL